MTYQTPHSLLSLPPGMTSPDAYRVLGLHHVESDRAQIQAAAESVMTRLRAAKATADPEAWKTAVQWVKDAYAVLADTSKKAAYDRKLASEPPTGPPTVDPLAGLLPGTSAGPAFHPGQVTQSPSTTSVPVGALLAASAAGSSTGIGSTGISSTGVSSSGIGSGSVSNAANTPDGLAAPTAVVHVPVVKGRSAIKRRRGLPWIPILLSVFSVATIAGLGAVIYVVQNGTPIIVNTSGGPLIGSAVAGEGRVASAPMTITATEKKRFDPVMGGFAGDMPVPSAQAIKPPLVSPPAPSPAEPERSAAAQSTAANPHPGMSSPGVSNPEMAAMPAGMPPGAATAVPSLDSTTSPTPSASSSPVPTPPTSTPAAPTPPQLQAGEAALAAIVTAIQTHQWEKLKPLSEIAAASAANEPQKDHAENLLQLVDLAMYYRGGIEKAISTLQAGNELDLSNDLKVVIVEAGPDRLVIRFNGRNKEYTFDTLPLSLAHKLAGLSMVDESPTAQAAKYAFQAIAPVTTAAYRDEAIAQLEQISGEVEGAQTTRLVAAIRHVYNL